MWTAPALIYCEKKSLESLSMGGEKKTKKTTTSPQRYRLINMLRLCYALQPVQIHQNE